MPPDCPAELPRRQRCPPADGDRARPGPRRRARSHRDRRGRVQRLRGRVRGQHRGCPSRPRQGWRQTRSLADAARSQASVLDDERCDQGRRRTASRDDGGRLESVLPEPPGLVPGGRDPSERRGCGLDGDPVQAGAPRPEDPAAARGRRDRSAPGRAPRPEVRVPARRPRRPGPAPLVVQAASGRRARVFGRAAQRCPARTSRDVRGVRDGLWMLSGTPRLACCRCAFVGASPRCSSPPPRSRSSCWSCCRPPGR